MEKNDNDWVLMESLELVPGVVEGTFDEVSFTVQTPRVLGLVPPLPNEPIVGDNPFVTEDRLRPLGSERN